MLCQQQGVVSGSECSSPLQTPQVSLTVSRHCRFRFSICRVACKVLLLKETVFIAFKSVWELAQNAW